MDVIDVTSYMPTTILIILAVVIILGVLLLILQIATCMAVIKMKDALNDIADVYCKINRAKYQEIKEQEQIDKATK